MTKNFGCKLWLFGYIYIFFLDIPNIIKFNSMKLQLFWPNIRSIIRYKLFDILLKFDHSKKKIGASNTIFNSYLQ